MIEVNIDEEGHKYSNESILKGILHHSLFDGRVLGNIGSGKRAEIIKSLGFSNRPTEMECASMMKTIQLEAYPELKMTVHKDLVNEVQNIYKDLKELGVELNNYNYCYFYRRVRNKYHPSAALSMHSFGCAIDLNYNLNPFDKNPQIRNDDVKKGIVRSSDNPIVQVFAKYGWGWGGRYYDYMHFSKANGG